MNAALDEDVVDSGLCDPDVLSRAGYFDLNGSTVDDGSKHYYYWMFESKGNPATDPVVLWLTGGPGCSSTLALLSENGPCKVNEDGTGTIPNAYGWNQNATVVWLDQPAGVGFSYGTENDDNEDMVGEDAYFFLQSLMAEHPQYSTQPFFVFGESFGGHYAPGVAHTIWSKNKANEAAAVAASVAAGQAAGVGDLGLGLGSPQLEVRINLAGLSVGNGLTDPSVQYAYYPKMAMNNTYGIKTVSEEQYESMVAHVPQCVALADACQEATDAAATAAAAATVHDSSNDKTNDSSGTNGAAAKASAEAKASAAKTCKTAQSLCGAWETTPYYQTGLNPYDIRIPCEVPGLCYNFSNVETFFNDPSVLEQLHVRIGADASSQWTECNYDVNAAFAPDWMVGYQGYVADLLDQAQVPVLIYAGDVDFVCNWIGNKAWTLALPWSGKDAYTSFEDVAWSIDSASAQTPSGLARSSGGFTFLQVYEAGHLVPQDQPEAALAMLNTFIHGGSFV